MSYLERLKAAKDAIGAKIPGHYLLLLARNPNVQSEEQVRELLATTGGMQTPQQLKALALIVAKAAPENEAPQATDPEPEKETEADSGVAQIQVTAAEEAPSVEPVLAVTDTGADQTSPEDTYLPQSSSQNDEAIPEPAEAQVPEEEPLDPTRLMEIDALAKSARPIEIEITDLGGQLQLSWPRRKTYPIYAVASGDSSSPKSLARATWFTHTRDAEVRIKSDHDFFTLFGFSGHDAKGVLLGYGRRLREVTRLQVEEFQSQIRLIWTVEDQGANVVLFRSKANQLLSANPSADRIVAKSVGDGSYVDEDVSPGEDYEYRACVQWEGPSRVLTTEGKTVSAGVFAPVPAIEEFAVTALSETEAEITFVAPPAPAKVRLFQVRGLPQAELLSAHQDTQERNVSLLSGDSLPAWLGTEIIADAKKSGGLVTVRSPILSGEVESRTYVGVAILGKRFRVMALKAIPQVGAIADLELIDRFDYQLLRVAAPPGAQYLEVWVAGEASKFEQISKLPPDRQVHLIDEYRRYGGVVFADYLEGVSGSATLGPEPREIFVRGATNFEGTKHAGPVASISHKGQIAVRYSRIEHRPVQEPAARGLFGRKSEPVTPQRASMLLGVQASTPNRFGSVISLQHLSAPVFPANERTANAQLFEEVRIAPGEYEVMETYRDQSGRTRLLDPSQRHRLRFTDSRGQIAGFPTFAVDTMPDGFSGFRQGAEGLNAELKVVILGSKQSGKTTYVQALLNYLKHQFSSLYVAKLLAAPGDAWAEKRLAEMEEFVTRGTLPAATRTAKPFFENPAFEDPNSPNPLRVLNFEIDNGDKVPLRKLGMVDVAGEDMDELETMLYYEDSLVTADLIILLADPLQLGPVQNAMAGLPLPPKGTDPHIVLRNLNLLLGNTQKEKNPRQRIAVVFSKFDGFQQFSQMEASAIPGAIQPGMAITRDPNSFSARLYNDADGALVQQEILSVMNQLDLASFIKLLENTVEPNRRRFFVSSSLGHSSHSDVMDAAGLTSWRISDPIRWALHNL